MSFVFYSLFSTLTHLGTPFFVINSSMKSIKASIQELLCLQGFNIINLLRLKWPLASIENDSFLHSLRRSQISMNFIRDLCLKSSNFEGFQILTTRWPHITFDHHNNNMVFELTKTDVHNNNK